MLVLIGSAVNALVAERNAEDDIFAELAAHIVVAVEQHYGRVSAYRDVRGVERLLAVAGGIAVGEHGVVEPDIALILIVNLICALSIGHR